MRLINTTTYRPQVFWHHVPEYIILSHRWQGGSQGEPGLSDWLGFLADLKLETRIGEHELRLVDSCEELRLESNASLECGSQTPGCDDISSLDSLHISISRRQDTLSADSLPTSAPSFGLQKVLDCCKAAREHQCEWIWIDTVCIDKTDSTELAEAINSMYRWYQEAIACFVYLYDVDANTYLTTLVNSDWFTRGWCLQELIAPQRALFFDKSWTPFGTRETLSNIVHQATGIPDDVLLDPQNVCQYNTAQRLSWAAMRETTRPEDETYCLLGLLEINMTLQYGEGAPRAFQRLQTLILEEFEDESLLAWQMHSASDSVVRAKLAINNCSAKAENTRGTESDFGTRSLFASVLRGRVFARWSFSRLFNPSANDNQDTDTKQEPTHLSTPRLSEMLSIHTSDHQAITETRTKVEIPCLVTGVLAQSPHQFQHAQSIMLCHDWMPGAPNRMSPRGLEVTRQTETLENASLSYLDGRATAKFSEASARRVRLACWGHEIDQPVEMYLIADYLSGSSNSWHRTLNRWRRIMLEDKDLETLRQLLKEQKHKTSEQHMFIALSWPETE